MREGACEQLSVDEYAEAAKTIVAAGRQFPSRVRLTQVRRELQRIDKETKDVGSQHKREECVQRLLNLCEPWTVSATPSYDPYDPMLSTAGVKPCQVVAFFATELFTRRLCEWMSRGEPYGATVMAFVNQAIELWSDLPEDSKMSSNVTNAWDNGLHTVIGVQLLGTFAVELGTRVNDFDTVVMLDDHGHRTMEHKELPFAHNWPCAEKQQCMEGSTSSGDEGW